MRRKPIILWLAFFLLFGCFAFSTPANAVDLYVRCGDHKAKLKTITDALRFVLPRVATTIHVTGTCTENLTINDADHLTLLGDPSATLNDASGGNDPVIGIGSSGQVTVQNFVIVGGGQGFGCGPFSRCDFINVVVRGAAFASNYGNGSRGWLQTTTIEGVTGGQGLQVRGANVVFDPDVVIQNNASHGLLIRFGGIVTAVTATIQGNAGSGVSVQENSVFRTNPGGGSLTITSNQGHGVDVQGGSVAYLGYGTNISGNAGNGVRLLDLSFAKFDSGASVTAVPGSWKVYCQTQNTATRGVANVATYPSETNCVE